MTDRKWTSIEQLGREFGVEALVHNRPALRSELRRRLAAAHPDTFGGIFPDEAHSAAYHNIESAMTFLDSQPDMTLVPVEQMHVALARITQHIESLNAAKGKEEVKTLKATAKEYSRRRILLPRVTSGAFLALCSAILAFPGQVLQHPFGEALLSREQTLEEMVFRDYEVERSFQLRHNSRTTIDSTEPITSPTPASTAETSPTPIVQSNATDDNASQPTASAEPSATLRAKPTPATTIFESKISDEEVFGDIARKYHLRIVPKDAEALRAMVIEVDKKYQQRRLISLCFPVLILSALGFAWTWYRENKVKVGIEMLGSEAALHKIFERLQDVGNPGHNFSFRDLLKVVEGGIAGAPPLPEPVAEQISATVINRLLERNAIHRAPSRGVDECFIVPPASEMTA
jgi:hypothetical protein